MPQPRRTGVTARPSTVIVLALTAVALTVTAWAGVSRPATVGVTADPKSSTSTADWNSTGTQCLQTCTK